MEAVARHSQVDNRLAAAPSAAAAAYHRSAAPDPEAAKEPDSATTVTLSARAQALAHQPQGTDRAAGADENQREKDQVEQMSQLNAQVRRTYAVE